jgi:hypothetical protein
MNLFEMEIRLHGMTSGKKGPAFDQNWDLTFWDCFSGVGLEIS